MPNAINYIRKANDHAKSIGATYVGSLVNLNVRLHTDVLDVQTIRQAIINNPVIPNEWAPEPLNKLSVYLHTATELNRSSMRKFIMPPDEDFNLDEFGGYHVKRLHLEKDSDIPVSHRVFFTRKIPGEIQSQDGRNKVVDDIEIESSIVVHLRRAFGGTEHDAEGTSTFRMGVNSDNCLPGDFPFFKPFIHTLKSLFVERTKGKYESSQVRELILNCLKKDIGVESINDGLYFVRPDDVDKVANLAAELNRLDPGVNVVNVPILKFPNQPPTSLGNEAFSEVSRGITRSLLHDIKALKEELDAFEESDANTRSQTWLSRRDLLKDLKEKYESYKAEEMILGDHLEDIMKECQKKIITNIAGT